MSDELKELIVLWSAFKILTPVILLAISGFSGLVVYYMREISRSIKDMTYTLVKHEERFNVHEIRIEALEEGCPLLREQRRKDQN
jgi:hypothetical protein